MENDPLRQSVWRGAWLETGRATRTLWFWLLQVIMGVAAAVIGYYLTPTNASPFFKTIISAVAIAGGMLVLMTTIMAASPIAALYRQRNEARSVATLSRLDFNEIIRRVIQELQEGIGRTGWSVGDIEQTWLDRMHNHSGYSGLPANIQDDAEKVRARTAAIRSMPRTSAIHDHANYVREAFALRNDLATLVAALECSRAVADTVGLVELDGFINLKMRVRADFRNKDTTQPHYMRYVEVTIKVPDWRKLGLYQISGEILRDYCFRPGETRTDDIMEFQLHVADRLPVGEFESLVKNYGDWESYLEICTAEGPTQYVDLEITGFLSKLVPNDPSKS